MSDQAQAPQTITRSLVESIATAVVDANRKIQQETGERPFETRMPSRTSAFNPTGAAKRPKLAHKVVFCCHEEKESDLTNEEIELYNQLTPGRYNNRKWEVIKREDPAGDRHAIEIRIPVDTHESRMELAYTASSLKQICRLIVDEAAARQKVAA